MQKQGKKPKYMTVRQIAAELGVGQQAVIRWIKVGELPGLKIGHIYRILRYDYIEFLEAHQVVPEDTRA
jgi:excisionase family DNA binding protein